MRRLLLVVALAAASLGGAPVEAAPASGFSTHVFTSPQGSRSYLQYVPAKLPRGPRPLVVMLHGCNINAQDMSRLDRFHVLADRVKAIVVWPEQDPDANGAMCWNWFDPEQQHRDDAEPSLIAGITRQVQSRLPVDRARTYVGGVSAGGAMTTVMLAAYPDVYAAGAIHAGCPYRGLPCVASASLIPPSVLAEWAYAEMGPRARVVPFFTAQGMADPAVTFYTHEQVIEQALRTADHADDGAANGSVPLTARRTREGAVPDGHTYSVRTFVDAAGRELGESWLVDGMGHTYSGGGAGETFGDPLGPDVTTASYAFFLRHPMQKR